MIRIGTGFDVHAYERAGSVGSAVAGATGGVASPLRLAGLDWPGEPALVGHSDGDAVCHAVVDALLSAAGLGDIGELVGVDEPGAAGAASTGFVRDAVARLAEEGWTTINVSVQIVGNRPRFAARRAEAQEVMSALVGAPVSLAATTTDHLGFTGRGEGLAVIATALIERTLAP
ncbi:2-C-methyl-D-erythritol 2,4-cyclodiphosphate synthase [Leucobacter sp. NPDC058333]|uniref:2-C-methyl-D-erythritol 2,4-cyclodiphosphate synthase n=1 Tax=Leucobacter sp. NPDC058333 TaxID=3346450 RepID=UPI00364DE4EF